jgi:methionine aminotransferase
MRFPLVRAAGSKGAGYDSFYILGRVARNHVNSISLSIASKLPGTGTTIFTVMSKMAQDLGAINLSQGYPDFDGPPALRDAVARHIGQGHNQYAPLAGIPDLKNRIAAKVEELYRCTVDAEQQVVVTPGATEAIYCALTATILAGDEVIVFDPAYDTYEPGIRLNGGVARRLPLQAPDFRIDWQRVRDTINGRTRMIMLNSPHNPTATVLGLEDIAALREIISDTDILLLSDEVYEHILFDGREHLSLLRYPDLARRSFCVFSFGKTYHVTGWRIGYCVAPPALTREFLGIHQFINFSTNTPLQYALADFMRDDPRFPLELAEFYQRKRDLFVELLEPSPFRLLPSHGTFFQLADYSAVSDLGDQEFAAWLTREHGVAVIPISVFYEKPPDQRIIRFCFAKNDATLRDAARRLATVAAG